MKKLLKSLTILTLVVIVFVSFSGCSSSSKNNAQTQNSKSQSKDEPNINEDKKATEELKKNKEVSNGKIYTVKDTAIATMIIKDKVSVDDAKKLADNYAKQLKKQYPNMKVNVQAVQDGKNIANVTIAK